MIYKAVPGPKVISVSDGNYNSATSSFASLINSEAVDGWKFHSMETITIQEKVGCALNQQVVNTNIYMLIFSKEQ